MSVQDEHDEHDLYHLDHNLNHLRGYVGRLMDYVIYHITRENQLVPAQTSTALLSGLQDVQDSTGTTNSDTEWLEDLKNARTVLFRIHPLFKKFVSCIPQQQRPPIVSQKAYQDAISIYDVLIGDFTRQLQDELDETDMSVQDEREGVLGLAGIRAYVGRLMDYVQFYIRRETQWVPKGLLSGLQDVQDSTGTTNSGTEWLEDLKNARTVLLRIQPLFKEFVSCIQQRPPIVSLNAYQDAIDTFDVLIDDFIMQLQDELDDEMGLDSLNPF